MNLMFIIPSLSGGGAERVTVTLASELCKEYNVVIVTYHQVVSPYNLSDKVKVECLNVSGGKNPIQKSLNSIKRIILLKKLKEAYKIDCAISLLYSPNFENVISRGKEKVIVSLRNKYSVNYKGFSGFINSISCKKADLSIALSKNVMQDQIYNYATPKNKIRTIYNPCDIDGIKVKSLETPSCAEFETICRESEYVVITAGRLIDQKSQWSMIRAFNEVVKKHPRAALVILGEGELKEYLLKLVIDMKLEKNVFLLGFHSNPYSFLSRANIFAFTSLFEGFGNILLEAMACSLPIVSCDCDAGPRELLAPDTDLNKFTTKIELAEYGILTSVMDGVKYDASTPLTKEELEYAKALLMLLDDNLKLEYYRMRSAQRIRDFSTDKIIKQWKKILN